MNKDETKDQAKTNDVSSTLTEADYKALAARGIDRATAHAARIRRASSAEGAQLVGRSESAGKSYAGLAIPYVRIGESKEREFRLRLDHPDLELRPDGSKRETGKYLSPPGRGSLIYFPLRATPKVLADTKVLIVFTEGEFKAIALDQLARRDTAELRYLAISIPGVWNFRGTVGKTEGPGGERRDLKGPIPDLDLIEWKRRRVLIAFDADGATNELVQIAENLLIKELRRRGATVAVLRWPLEDGKGVDDLIANKGAEYFLQLIEGVDWDQAVVATERDRQQQNQADVLVGIALGNSESFIDGDHAFADIDDGVVRRTMKVRSTHYKRWLRQLYYRARQKSPSAESMTSAIDTLEARAHFAKSKICRQVFTRTAEADGKLYLDLGDDDWRAIEIDREGWQVVSKPPVRFQRSPGMMALPAPETGGTLDDLRGLLNVRDDDDLILIVAWLLAALRPKGPFPLLSFSGEQGSAKSTAARILRWLIDPNRIPLRSLPRDERDLYIAAIRSHALNFDNLSGLSAWISDALCRLATGGGFTTRTLYTDDEETMFDAMRPIIVNGIVDAADRSDLADRAIVVTLEPILEANRKPENYLQAKLEADAPKVLGLLLDGLSRGLSRLDSVRFERLPRMADFASWAVACGDGFLWPEGVFMAAYEGNRAKAVEEVIESDQVAVAVRRLAGDGPWEGTCTELLEKLSEVVGEKATRTRKWPKTASALSGQLRRVGPALRRVGINVEFYRVGRARGLRISATPLESERDLPSSPSSPSQGDLGGLESTTYEVTPVVTHSPPVEDSPSPSASPPKPLKTRVDDARDGDDGDLPPLSGDWPDDEIEI